MSQVSTGGPRQRIGTTSAAILGLLAAQPGTAYALAQRMKRNHHFIWPRAESKLYEEVKRLQRVGLVTVQRGSTGRRQHSVYRISARGRRALALWSKQPSSEPSLSFEALVKLAYADFGTVADARAHIASVQKHAEQMVALGRELAARYLDDAVELPERAHTNVLVWRFLAAQYRAMLDWAYSADAIVAAWDGTRPSPYNRKLTRKLFGEGLAILQADAPRRVRKTQRASPVK